MAHYLDDYITMGPPGSNTCTHNLEVMLSTCAGLGVPTAPGKCAGPASSLVFLGFELDTEALVVRLPSLNKPRDSGPRLVTQESMHKEGVGKSAGTPPSRSDSGLPRKNIRPEAHRAPVSSAKQRLMGSHQRDSAVGPYLVALLHGGVELGSSDPQRNEPVHPAGI